MAHRKDLRPFPTEIWLNVLQFATYCPRHPLLPVDSPSDWDSLYNRHKDFWQEARYHVHHLTSAQKIRYNLMRVCKTWYNVLVKEMYTSLAFDETWRIDAAEDTFATSSHLSPYAKYILVDLGVETVLWDITPDLPPYRSRITGPNRKESDRLMGILSTCPNIELFVVFGAWIFPWCLTKVPSLSPTLTTFCYNTCMDISIPDLNNFLLSFPSLVNLYCYSNKNHLLSGDDPPPPIRLEHLRVLVLTGFTREQHRKLRG